MYFFKARWLDPALGRWLQPDSLVPDLYNPLDWDRYSYARNNTVKFIDPSRHKPCEGETESDCGWFPGTLGAVKSMLHIHFGITLKNGSDRWNYSTAEGILLDSIEMGWTMSRVMCDPDACVYLPSDVMFLGIFGNTTLVKELAKESGKYSGEIVGSTIFFYGNFPSSLVFHEFGHRFDYRGNGVPTRVLGGTQIYDVDGNFVSGFRNGGYDRGGGIRAPALSSGYAVNTCLYQCHSRTMDEDGNSANEEWADMYMNNVQDTFVGNPAGNALSEWIATNLIEFIVAIFQ